MAESDDYIADACSLTGSVFARKYQHPFFLAVRPEVKEGEWRFKTQTVASSRALLAHKLASRGIEASEDLAALEVFGVVKSDNNPWRERISVGRARNNDVVLLDRSVSKLHAHLTPAEGQTALMMLSDLDSRNGTCRNGERLLARTPVALQDGDKITIGCVELTIFSSAALQEFIAARIRQGG